jgi:hypothetical protein
MIEIITNLLFLFFAIVGFLTIAGIIVDWIANKFS